MSGAFKPNSACSTQVATEHTQARKGFQVCAQPPYILLEGENTWRVVCMFAVHAHTHTHTDTDTLLEF